MKTEKLTVQELTELQGHIKGEKELLRYCNFEPRKRAYLELTYDLQLRATQELMAIRQKEAI